MIDPRLREFASPEGVRRRALRNLGPTFEPIPVNLPTEQADGQRDGELVF